MTSTPLPPIVRTISVVWEPRAAFRRFTTDVMTWWPWRSHSIGAEYVDRVVFEACVGGRFFEEHKDGRRFQWGEILEWDPPRRVRFTFHPSREAHTAQTVDVLFEPEGEGTRLTLTVTNWEKWGPNAHRARRGYDIGWGYVLNVFAGVRTRQMLMLDVAAALARPFRLLMHGGRRGVIRKAGGEIARG